ncbi:MAG TPA: hypothetical protein VD867_02530 [Burkholderiales bacterium]|nr:hypothetical protein [Burkholderiales bacterium]
MATEAGKWKWIVTSSDGSRAQSAEEFARLGDCTSNAAEHGYVVWKSEDERRHELKLGVVNALKRGVR